MSASFLGLGCLGLLVIFGVAPLVIAYLVLRKSDPEHALKRTTGLGILSLGSIALTVALVTFAAVRLQSNQPFLEAEFTPDGSSTTHYGRIGLGPGGLSVWLLVAGATIALGLFLFVRRFSLRSLLIVLGLMALLASTPQLLVQSPDPKGVITVKSARTLNGDEWREAERMLTKHALCDGLPEEVTAILEMPAEAALAQVDLERILAGEAEATGTLGARLHIRFSGELDNGQAQMLFDHLCERAQQAVQREDTP